MPLNRRKERLFVYMRHAGNVALMFAVLALFAGTLAGCDLLTSDETRIERAKELNAKGDYRTAVIELKKVLENNANNKDARLLLGQVSLAAGQVAAAEKELRRAHELGMPFDQVVIPLGQALLVQGNYSQVLDELDPAIIESSDVKGAVLVLRGDAYLATNKLRDAERSFREVLALDPDSINGRIGLAKTAQVVGDFEGAEAHLNEALQRGPNSVAVWLAKGQLEFQRKRYAEAEEAFNSAIAKGEPRVTAVQEFIARNGLAEAQWRQGKSDAARHNVEKMAALAPRHPRPKYLRAVIAYGAGDYETAVQQLQQVLRLYPDNRPAQLLLGAAHYAKGNLEQADMYLSSVLATEPSSIQARKLLAATRIREQKPDDALNTLHPAVAQGTDDVQLLALMSRASFQAGDADGGISYLEQGLKADPGDQVLQMDLAAGYLSSGELERAIEILEKLPETKEGPYRREVLLILAYLRKHDTANALTQGQKLLADRPNDAGVRNLVGSIYMVGGDTQKARQQFDKALQLQPESPAVLMNLGRLEFREGKQDAARGRFEHVLQISPKNVNAMLALAQLSAARGDRQQVRQWLERASAVNPQNVGPRLLLVRHYLLAERDIAKAEELATDLARDVPENAEVQNALGIVQMAERNFRAAAESFRKATRLAPKSGNFQYNLARAELAQQNFGEAKRLLIRALELQPDHIPATSTLAMLEMRDGKGTQALARARNLQKNKTTRATGYGLEGDLQMMQRQYSKAVVAYDKAASDADSAAIALKSYEARRRAKMPDATKPLNQWLEKSPNDARVRLALAQDYQMRGQLQQAITQYELLVRNNPNSAGALNNLAWLYHEAKDSRALGTAERAYELQPESGAIADTLGWLLVQEGQVERGLALLRKAVEQAPKVPDIRYHLGVALAKAGAKDEARKTLSELVNSGENFKDMPEAKRLLENL
jgi:putative PEP-CTERM system TPR-repeat lipoprotein